jgi:MFS family permease
MTAEAGTTIETASFAALLRGGNAGRSAVVAGGISLHAVNVFLVATVMPSIVQDIGGLSFFAWSTTLYVVASLLASSNCARAIRLLTPRGAYRLALVLFVLGCAICATAPAMGVLLLGRLVQGLGAGTLSALSFTMVRALFPAPLWPRAFTLISLAWGVATMGGPAIGGVFAETLGWRLGFWALAALAPLLLALVEICLPRAPMDRSSVAPPVAWLNLGLLAGSALAVSAGSTAESPWLNALGLGVATGGFVLFSLRERSGGARVLPRGAMRLTTRLGATYAVMALLLVGVNTEIFVPYFLQRLHGLSPLHAGYMSALMSGGWACVSLFSAGTRRVALMTTLGPLLLALGLGLLAVLMPQAGPGSLGLGSLGLDGIALGIALMGAGIGMCWPQLGAAVFAAAPEDERNLASASITSVTMLGNAFGSALGGMVTNLAGMAEPALAATTLFGLYTMAPLVALLLMPRIRQR